MGEWTEWSVCDATCTRVRHRSVVREAQKGGKCAPTMQQELCTGEQCPVGGGGGGGFGGRSCQMECGRVGAMGDCSCDVDCMRYALPPSCILTRTSLSLFSA